MHAMIVVLYVLSATLPVAGFGRLLSRAQRNVKAQARRIDEKGSPDLTWDDMDELGSRFAESVIRERNDLLWDVALVGAGLTAGAAASIWALFL